MWRLDLIRYRGSAWHERSSQKCDQRPADALPTWMFPRSKELAVRVRPRVARGERNPRLHRQTLDSVKCLSEKERKKMQDKQKSGIFNRFYSYQLGRVGIQVHLQVT